MHRSLVLVLACWPFGSLLARNDVRELCRQEVSGTYLRTQSDIDQGQGLLTKTHLQLQELTAEAKLSRTKLAKLEAAEADADPIAQWNEETMALRHNLETLEGQIKEINQDITNFKSQLAEKSAFLKRFENLIAPVFTKSKETNRSEGAYPLRLDYRHKCSEYLLLCPLPRAQAKALKALGGALQDDRDCQRYAQLPPESDRP